MTTFIWMVVIKWVNQLEHLSNSVNIYCKDDTDIKCHVFNGSVNKLIGNYGNLSPDTLCNLFKSYCCSFYGSQLWNLKSNGFHSCCVQWNKAVRRLYNLPYRTHTWLLGPLIGQSHISVQLAVKTLRFIHGMVKSSNCIVSYIALIAKHCAMSPTGQNLSHLKYIYNVDLDDKLGTNISRIANFHSFTEKQQNIFDIFMNLIDLKNNKCYVDGFDDDMVETMLYSVACD